MTDLTSPSGSTPAEAEAFLEAHPGIEAFDIVLHDANGIGRGKIIRRHELMPLFKGGRHLPISILGLDITGEDVHETGLIWGAGDGDLRAWPAPSAIPECTAWAVLPRDRVLRDYALDLVHVLAPQVDRRDLRRVLEGNQEARWPEPPSWEALTQTITS